MPTTIDLLLDGKPEEHSADQLHGLACAVLEGPGVDHDANSKAFTVWPIREDPVGAVLRLTLLAEYDASGRELPRQLRLGRRTFGIRHREDRHVSFAELASRPPRTSTTLLFETPTYFSRNGRDYPLPDPGLVFGGLARKWNDHAHGPLAIPEDLIRDLTSNLVIEDLDIRAMGARAAHRNKRCGFTGSVTYRLLVGGAHTAALLAVLSHSAQYLGVGAQTTRGFGVVLEV